MHDLIAQAHRVFGTPPRRFDKQMRATNACLAALALADGIDRIAELIAAWMSGRARQVDKLVRQIERRVAELGNPLVRQTQDPAPVAPINQLKDQIERCSQIKAIAVLLLGGDLETSYEKPLDLLRGGKDQTARDCILDAKIGKALAELTDQTPVAVAKRVRDAAATHARLLIVLAGIRRADNLGVLATRPLGDTHLRTSSRPVLVRAYNETLLEPARLIIGYAKALQGKDAMRVADDDEQTIAFLKSKSLLPHAPLTLSITELALKVRARLASDANKMTATAFDFVERQVGLFLTSANAANPPAEWSHETFVDFRIGLTGVEAATYLAREILIAIERSDAIVYHDAVRAARATTYEPAAMKVRWLAELLRSAAGIDPLVSRDPNRVNHNGEAAYRSMLAKLDDQEVAHRAHTALSIDIEAWLGR